MKDSTIGMIYRIGSIFLIVFFGVYIPATLSTKIDHTEAEYSQYRTDTESRIAQLERELSVYKASYKKAEFVQQEIDCLAQNIYYEAALEPYEGKLAVAEVTVNRVKSKAFPKTVCGVVQQQHKGVCQFSWVCKKKAAIIKTYSAWKDARKIAENFLVKNKRTSVVKGATYFHADHITPNWVDEKTYITQIGQHVFYN